MRTKHLLVSAMLVAGCVIPPGGQATAEVGVVAAPGPDVVVFAYEQSYFGPWRTAYIDWTPVTIYYVSGHYYRAPVRGARAVVVYSRGRDYFFPPRDRAWHGFDKRFDHSRGPTWRDYGRAKQKDNGKRHGNGHS